MHVRRSAACLPGQTVSWNWLCRRKVGWGVHRIVLHRSHPNETVYAAGSEETKTFADAFTGGVAALTSSRISSSVSPLARRSLN